MSALPSTAPVVELGGVGLAGPVLNGSGTFDAIAAHRAFGDALLERFPFHAFVSKTITVEPRQGNEPPRLWETPAGLINSIGLPNKGVDGFLKQDLPRLAELPVPLMVSVMGFSRDELALLVERVEAREEVETARAVERLRPLTDKPLVVKLTPNAVDPAAVAVAAEGAGADAISLINTLKGMAFAPNTREPWLGGGTGGVSGPAVRAVALQQVAAVSSRVAVPVIGMGGIATGRDALDFLAAGASCVAVGTESFRDPSAGARIGRDLATLAAPQEAKRAYRNS
jgi:dihydroorotate dehydrogenase (NAD+) catalytic subunit